jgi:release factor glutamine methyltransferase
MSVGTSLGEVLDGAVRRLRAAGVATPRLDARLLAARALGIDSAAVLARDAERLESRARARIDDLVERRARREPMAHILGTREFWSRPIAVGPAVLTPRPETETLVEAALAWGGTDRPALSVLDLGTGSGCLLAALLGEWPSASGVGVDIDGRALEVARANARALGFADRTHFVCADWGDGLAGSFDVVLCNPPYVREADIDGLMPEVALFEPRRALSGGADGLDAYRALGPRLGRLIAPGGAAFLEIGSGQAAGVSAILRKGRLTVVDVAGDLAGEPCCVTLRHAERPVETKKGLETAVNATSLMAVGGL